MKIKESIRYLIVQLGGLVFKSGLDSLDIQTIYGMLLSNKSDLNLNLELKQKFHNLGKEDFEGKQKSQTAIILKLNKKPTNEIRTYIRNHGLKWNRIREEWYGYIWT